MTDADPDDVIGAGWEVRDADGVPLGRVADVTPGYVVVDRSETGAPTLYVPAGSVEAAGVMEVSLEVSASELPALDWEQAPADLDEGDEPEPMPATPDEVVDAMAAEEP